MTLIADNRFNIGLDNTENSAQFGALIRISMSPSAPNLPRKTDRISPFVTTKRTPIVARINPAIICQDSFSLRNIQPRSAIKMGDEETNHAVVDASDVTSPLD